MTDAGHRESALFISKSSAGFAKKDQEFLQTHFKCTIEYQEKRRGIYYFWFGIGLLFQCLRLAPTLRIVFIWFADYHTLLPSWIARLLGVPVYVVVGGFETRNIPEIGYGGFIKKSRKFSIITTFRLATRILPVHRSLVEGLGEVGDLADRICPIPTGYDHTYWVPKGVKKEIFLCVALISDQRSYYRKGIDRYIALAKQLPEFNFQLVGVQEFELFEDIPKNLELFGVLSRDQVREKYQDAKYICLFSLTEGLPNTVCEAMLCECIPIVTDGGGMRDQVANHGFVINNQSFSAEALADEFPELPERFSPIAIRSHVIQTYPLERRKKELMELLKQDGII